MRVKISAIKHRANRLNQPEMVDKWRKLAITWDRENNICEVTDEEREYLNSLWNESKKPVPAPKPKNVSRKDVPFTKTDNLHNKWKEIVREIENGDNQDWKDELGRWRRKIEELENRGGCGCNKKAAEARKKRFMEMHEKWRDAVS